MNNVKANTLHKPHDSTILSDDTDNWAKFRQRRFAVAGDGEYAVLKDLHLTGLDLHSFAVDHLVFLNCDLNDTSFAGTEFVFNTAFIDCTMRNVDFRRTHAADALFYGCDLAGAIFSTDYSWTDIDLDGQKISSYFIDCILSSELSDELRADGTFVGKLDELGELKPRICQAISEASSAPLIDL